MFLAGYIANVGRQGFKRLTVVNFDARLLSITGGAAVASGHPAGGGPDRAA
jgi:hypothetical protein